MDDRDLRTSYALGDAKNLGRILCGLRATTSNLQRLVALGCGCGGLNAAIADFLEVKEAYGIDVDESRIEVARDRCRFLALHRLDLENEPLPFEDGSVDVVTCFGVLEHLVWWDTILIEVRRVLRDGGYFLVSLPNLRSYLQVLSLLLGYQPRDIEVSRRYLVGVLPFYTRDGPARHVHTVTIRAFEELINAIGFEVTTIRPLRNKVDDGLLDIVDRAACLFTSMARRFVVLASKRPSSSVAEDGPPR